MDDNVHRGDTTVCNIQAVWPSDPY